MDITWKFGKCRCKIISMCLLVPNHLRQIFLAASPEELGHLKDDLLALRANGLGRDRIIDKATEAGWDRNFVAWYVDALNEHGRDLEIETSVMPMPPPHVELVEAPPLQPTKARWTAGRKFDLVIGLFIFLVGVWAVIPAIQQPMDSARAALLVIIPAFVAISGLFVAFNGVIGHLLWILLAMAMFGIMMQTAASPTSDHAKGIPIYLMGAYGLGRLFPKGMYAVGWILAGVLGIGSIGVATYVDSANRAETAKAEQPVADLPSGTPLEQAKRFVQVIGDQYWISGSFEPKHPSVQKLLVWIDKEGRRLEQEQKEMSADEYGRFFDTTLFVTDAGRKQIRETANKFRQMTAAWDVKAKTEELNSILVEIGAGPLKGKDEYIQSQVARNASFLKFLNIHDQLLDVVASAKVTVDKNGKLIFRSNHYSKYQRLTKQLEETYKPLAAQQERAEKMRQKLDNELEAIFNS